MQGFIREIFGLVLVRLIRGHPQVKPEQESRVVALPARTSTEETNQPRITQDASPPGNKIRWWT